MVHAVHGERESSREIADTGAPGPCPGTVYVPDGRQIVRARARRHNGAAQHDTAARDITGPETFRTSRRNTATRYRVTVRAGSSGRC